MKRVGVIGGGQLAWMMAEAAQALGIELAIQTPYASDPAVAIATHTVLAPIDDVSATAQLATHCDVITFENEFVNLSALALLVDQGIHFYPSLAALAPLLDKYEQRSYLQMLGIPTPGFQAVTVDADAKSLSQLGFPVVLKARRHGYDGQGTFILKTLEDLQAVLQQGQPRAWMIEEFVPFERELAIMAARSVSGEIVTYPVVETQQENQVCRRVLVTGEVEAAVTEEVVAIAHHLLASLQFVGILGIELFLTAQGRVLVNEIAPRTHNSGHFTLDACMPSQFEQQLRAVCGLPLGKPAMRWEGAVMVNLLGYESAQDTEYWHKRQVLAQLPQTHVHWYGKAASRPGRKLGHVTTLLGNPVEAVREKPASDAMLREQALAMVRAIEAIWYP